jgi:hypothetical protein
MYSHVEYFNYSLHALRILHLTLHESIVAYTKQCVALEGPFTTAFITRAARAAPDGASDTHGQIAHGYTSSLQKLGDIINMKR